jgi:hypothetical protein
VDARCPARRLQCRPSRGHELAGRAAHQCALRRRTLVRPTVAGGPVSGQCSDHLFTYRKPADRSARARERLSSLIGRETRPPPTAANGRETTLLAIEGSPHRRLSRPCSKRGATIDEFHFDPSSAPPCRPACTPAGLPREVSVSLDTTLPPGLRFEPIGASDWPLSHLVALDRTSQSRTASVRHPPIDQAESSALESSEPSHR